MLAEALWNAPVGIHTITGAGEAGAGLGVQMFSFRQFSLPAVVLLPGGLTFAQGPGATVALEVPAHGVAGWGGFHRKLASGGTANGIPRKAQDEPLSTPCTAPVAALPGQNVPQEGIGPQLGGDKYALVEESGFLSVKDAPLSTFSIDPG